MNIFLTWKKGFFSNTYKLYSNGIESGFLKLNIWSNRAKGVLKDKEIEISTKGFFKQETTIMDSKTQEILGTISFGIWKNKTIFKKSTGEEFNWQFNNFWSTKWSLTNSYTFINYKGSFTKGEINSNSDDEILLIIGLFIANYYWQKRAGIAAAT